MHAPLDRDLAVTGGPSAGDEVVTLASRGGAESGHAPVDSEAPSDCDSVGGPGAPSQSCLEGLLVKSSFGFEPNTLGMAKLVPRACTVALRGRAVATLES